MSPHVPVRYGRHACVFLKVAAKEGLIGEA